MRYFSEIVPSRTRLTLATGAVILLAACAHSVRRETTAAPAFATQPQMQAARKAVNRCLYTQSFVLDDGHSPAALIGHRVAVRCTGPIEHLAIVNSRRTADPRSAYILYLSVLNGANALAADYVERFRQTPAAVRAQLQPPKPL